MDQSEICLTKFWERAEAYVTRGRPVELRLDMTVCELHQLWDDLWARGNRVADALNRHAEKLRRQAQVAIRKDKIELNKQAAFHAARAQAVVGIAENRFGEAHEDMVSLLVLDDDQREAFLNDISHRPGIEHTWQMTLQQVADHIAATVPVDAPMETIEPPATEKPEPMEADSPRIYVDAARLDCGMWLPQGDIHAAHSLQSEPRKGKPRRVKVFRHDNTLWTVLGACYSQFRNSADGYPLIPESEYNGPTDKVPYSYEGEQCVYKEAAYRLGPKHEFIAKDRPVEQWQKLLRSQYEKGGYFTSGKTYHEFIHDRCEQQWWSAGQRNYVHGSTVAPNYFKAAELDLAKPDFNKWQAEPLPNETHVETMEQLALAFM